MKTFKDDWYEVVSKGFDIHCLQLFIYVHTLWPLHNNTALPAFFPTSGTCPGGLIFKACQAPYGIRAGPGFSSSGRGMKSGSYGGCGSEIMLLPARNSPGCIVVVEHPFFSAIDLVTFAVFPPSDALKRDSSIHYWRSVPWRRIPDAANFRFLFCFWCTLPQNFMFAFCSDLLSMIKL